MFIIHINKLVVILKNETINNHIDFYIPDVV